MRIDGLGRLTVYAGGMKPSATSPIDGGPLVIQPGRTTLRLRFASPDDYQGDLPVRVSRLTPIEE